MRFSNPFKEAETAKTELRATRSELATAKERLKESETRLQQLLSHQDTRYRLGVIRVNTPRLQADLRKKVPSIRIEGPQAEQMWVITADGPHAESDVNAIRAQLQSAFEIDPS